jgi:hypothetical protein
MAEVLTVMGVSSSPLALTSSGVMAFFRREVADQFLGIERQFRLHVMTFPAVSLPSSLEITGNAIGRGGRGMWRGLYSPLSLHRRPDHDALCRRQHLKRFKPPFRQVTHNSLLCVKERL